MTGNTLNNVAFPTSERDVPTKAYVDSNSAADKVSKSGYTMTGDLMVNAGAICLMGVQTSPFTFQLFFGVDFCCPALRPRWSPVRIPKAP